MIVVPEKMGRINTRIVLECLRRLRLASRADLAKRSGLSQPTVGKIVDRLLEQGLIREVGSVDAAEGKTTTVARLGRPGRMLELDHNEPRFLVIQLGVSETCVAALPVSVVGEDRWVFRMATEDTAEGWIKKLRTAMAQVKCPNLWGVLVSVPGIVDENAGRILFSPNLHWIEREDLIRLVRGIWDVPVMLVQEERALALGHQNTDPSCDDFLLADFGDGVGGAVIIDGQPYSGPLPINGELGHTRVHGNERRCGCGVVGCLETLVSFRGLLQSFATVTSGQPKWATLVKHVQQHGVEPWMGYALDAAAGVIGGTLNVLGLRRVVVTGSLAEMPPVVMDYLASSISKSTLWARFGDVSCQAAPRRRGAGMVAAAIDRLVLPIVEQTVVVRQPMRERTHFI